MAGKRKPGPQCQCQSPDDVADGTSPVASMPPPGSVGGEGGVWRCDARSCPGHSRPEHQCQHRLGLWKQRRGSEQVPGLGARKRALQDLGGTVLDLAVALLETREMVADYPFGDVDPCGCPKIDDAANFGIFKQNWLMIRSSWAPYAHLGPRDYRTGAALNDDLALDVQVLHASQQHFASQQHSGSNRLWFAGHRNGATGLAKPFTGDIRRYREAVEWIQEQLNADPRYLTDDTRFWVNVGPI
jgi:hypothetical protein